VAGEEQKQMLFIIGDVEKVKTQYQEPSSHVSLIELSIIVI
jgi:hypothetical protein